MEYILAVTSKYLQMLVAYSIFKEDPDQVADHFEQFNRNFDQMCQAFKEVTNQTFQAGQEVEALKPVAPVKPIQRESKPELGLSDNGRIKLQQFLERHGLQELLPIFMKEGVALHDILEMTDQDMKELGIKAYTLRKRLQRVIENQRANENTATVSEEQVQSEVLRAWRGARGSSTDTQLVEETQRSLHLEEAQKSGPPVPASLVEKCQAVVAAGGVSGDITNFGQSLAVLVICIQVLMLEELMRELPDLLQRNTDLLTESERMLREESESDSSLRAQHGAKWSQTPSDELNRTFTVNATKYRTIINNSMQADSVVKEKWTKHMAGMQTLSRGEAAVAAQLPQGGSGGSSKEVALKSLTEAYNAFMELKGNLEEGTEFYKNLTLLLVTFQHKVVDFYFARKTEKDTLLKDLQGDHLTL